MNLQTTGLKLVLICCLTLASLAWAAQASAAETEYACKCKGIKEQILFVTTYGDCGNGFTGGNKGHVDKHIPQSEMIHYLPHVVIDSIHATNCGYYESSGWNCGRMKSGKAPSCIND